MTTPVFRVLFVCTGNVCRSPVAQQLVAARLASVDRASAAVHVSSAGTAALVGAEMPLPAQELSRAFGAEPQGHEPQLLTQELVESADLVVALTREHRADVVRLVPRASRSTVTLREAARLLESVVRSAETEPAVLGELSAPAPDVATYLRRLVGVMMAERGYAEAPPSPEDDDVVDPFGQPQEVYDRTGHQIVDAVDRAEAALRQLLVRAGGFSG